jgi:hypothetical protein
MVRNLNIDRFRIGLLEADARFVIDADAVCSAVLSDANCNGRRAASD